MSNFQDLFVSGVRSLYYAEGQVVATLPNAIQIATSKDLKEVLQTHLEETKRNIKRIELVTSDLGIGLRQQRDGVMTSFIQELEGIITADYDSKTKDAAILAIFEHIGRYEMSMYKVLKEYAKYLDFDEVYDLLSASLDEEKRAEKELYRVAHGNFFKSGIDRQARKKCA